MEKIDICSCIIQIPLWTIIAAVYKRKIAVSFARRKRLIFAVFSLLFNPAQKILIIFELALNTFRKRISSKSIDTIEINIFNLHLFCNVEIKLWAVDENCWFFIEIGWKRFNLDVNIVCCWHLSLLLEKEMLTLGK
jgi:hypothetical protein